MDQCILLIGASGTGTTTIGISLARTLGIPHIDLDNLFWHKTDPPFTHFRSGEDLKQLVNDQLYSQQAWVISGDPSQWKVGIEAHLSHVIFLSAPTDIRLQRIQHREEARNGADILPGGKMYQIHQEFMVWSSKYDQGGISGRTRERHERWLSKLDCPVLHLESTASLSSIQDRIYTFLQS